MTLSAPTQHTGSLCSEPGVDGGGRVPGARQTAGHDPQRGAAGADTSEAAVARLEATAGLEGVPGLFDEISEWAAARAPAIDNMHNMAEGKTDVVLGRDESETDGADPDYASSGSEYDDSDELVGYADESMAMVIDSHEYTLESGDTNPLRVAHGDDAAGESSSQALKTELSELETKVEELKSELAALQMQKALGTPFSGARAFSAGAIADHVRQLATLQNGEILEGFRVILMDFLSGEAGKMDNYAMSALDAVMSFGIKRSDRVETLPDLLRTAVAVYDEFMNALRHITSNGRARAAPADDTVGGRIEADDAVLQVGAAPPRAGEWQDRDGDGHEWRLFCQEVQRNKNGRLSPPTAAAIRLYVLVRRSQGEDDWNNMAGNTMLFGCHNTGSSWALYRLGRGFAGSLWNRSGPYSDMAKLGYTGHYVDARGVRLPGTRTWWACLSTVSRAIMLGVDKHAQARAATEGVTSKPRSSDPEIASRARAAAASARLKTTALTNYLVLTGATGGTNVTH